jgi:hypothetical protein
MTEIPACYRIAPNVVVMAKCKPLKLDCRGTVEYAVPRQKKTRSARIVPLSQRKRGKTGET